MIYKKGSVLSITPVSADDGWMVRLFFKDEHGVKSAEDCTVIGWATVVRWTGAEDKGKPLYDPDDADKVDTEIEPAFYHGENGIFVPTGLRIMDTDFKSWELYRRSTAQIKMIGQA